MSDQPSDTPGPGAGRLLQREQGQRADARRVRRRSERGDERRHAIVGALRGADQPLLGADLAQQFCVSRQALVHDMAILRAAGVDILTTSRGYLLRAGVPSAHRAVLQVRHDAAAMVEELTLLIDLGLRVVDIAIDHPIYGRLRADLRVASRRDIGELAARFAETGAGDLGDLTGGRHSHTVEAPRPDRLERARAALRERGFSA